MSIIDKNNTYILVEDADNVTYKLPIQTLADIIVMSDEDNEKMSLLSAAIDELSTYILQLSADFIAEHYSMEDLSTYFELKSDVEYLNIDKNILTENDVESFLKDQDLILIDKVEEKYDAENTAVDDIIDQIQTEADAYMDD